MIDEGPRPVGPRSNIYVGTCWWTAPSLIKCKRFYPRGCSSAEARLRYYASRFPVVEVDSSYFAMPNPSKAQLWAEGTPPGFRLNFRPFRLFTGHQTPPQAFPPDIQQALPPLSGRSKNWYYKDVPQEVRDELWRRFIEALAPLQIAGKLKPVHFQFAPWVTRFREWREHVEHCVERMAGHLVAVEFRNQTWLSEANVESTLIWERELNVSHVIVDEPQVGNHAHTVWAVANPALAIVRLHGRNEDTWEAKSLTASSERFNYEYDDAALTELAQRAARLADEAFELQMLVNVNYEDQGTRAAERLQRLLG